MSLEDKLSTIKDETVRLLEHANTPLPESQDTLGDAVKMLVDGYGGGGGDQLFADLAANKIVNLDYTDETMAVSVRLYMFAGCTNLVTAKLYFPYMSTFPNNGFEGCTKLTDVDIKGRYWNSGGTRMFYGCTALKRIRMRSRCNYFPSNFIDNCSSLEVFDIESVQNSYSYLPANIFRYCQNTLKHIIIRQVDGGGIYSSQITRYNTTNATYDPKNAELKIYVPRALVDTYKTAANWSRLASHFVALEDFTTDGTRSGEIPGVTD